MFIQRKLIKGGCFIDVKAVFDQEALEQAGIRVWRV
jgi:UDP-N-acetyl-D-galactosamine dehydrogenase